MVVVEKVRPGSPEPLPVDPKAVVVDLGGTLISGGQERPGATRLLQEFKSRGLQ